MFLWGIMMVRSKYKTGHSLIYFRYRQCKVSFQISAASWVRGCRKTNSLCFEIVYPIAMRWLLGMFEAGLFPGVTYYLSWCVLASRPVPDETVFFYFTSYDSAWRWQLVQAQRVRYPNGNIFLRSNRLRRVRRSTCSKHSFIPPIDAHPYVSPRLGSPR